MSYYLRKHWLINALVIFLQIAWAGVTVLTSGIIIIQSKQIFDMNLRGFVFWSLVSISFWMLHIALEYARTWAKSKAKMVMNNHVRRDIAATLLHQDYQTFHQKDTGDYLSMMTNDVKQMTALGWDSFYSIVSITFQVVFSMIGLAILHWSLLAATLVMSVIIMTIPNLLSKRAAKLGEDCAQQQAKAMNKMKDLLQGLDVLRFFDRSRRFEEQNAECRSQPADGTSAASDDLCPGNIWCWN